ncbi:type VII secretion protein EccB [Solihabitans fulvus]|uniref:Type VII secretion protein EccB n=1 Tax=Solihabitans fulvus TaxID=1892852 RepID=A0A5B2XSQ9_9PSEU|nr:type VII secretion protein EccB [Solihabitans fulvus]KAA2266476.1 type VII secretion protein EccB [Solihabitans fulvus]
MWTQRDQIQAYQFLRRRLVSSLVAADANHPISPSRRLVLGTILGLAAALLVTAGFGVVGALNPSGAADWRQGGQVIVEAETGGRYILGQDGLLHPVLNYASARLLAGGNGDKTVTVPAKALASASRGLTVGISGAPDSLPAADRLAVASVMMCSRALPNVPEATERVTTAIVGGTDSAHKLGDGQALLVQQLSGQRYLITGGHRLALTDPAVAAALGYGDAPAVTVARAWLNAVPAGKDLRAAPAGRAPTLVPPPAATDAVCVAGDGQTNAEILLSDRVPLPSGAKAMTVKDPLNKESAGADPLMANEVYVPPGSGALVSDQPAPNAPGGTSYLITDSGMKFPVSGQDAVRALGYGGVKPQGVATGLLALLPTGPALDPTAAQRPVGTKTANG